MKNLSEKRKAVRYRCRVPVESKKGTIFDKTRAIDISKSGLGLISANSISPAQKIPVEIVLTPEGEGVLVMGEVKWVRQLSDSENYRIGMIFTDLLSGSQSHLDKHFLKSAYV